MKSCPIQNNLIIIIIVDDDETKIGEGSETNGLLILQLRNMRPAKP